MFRLLSLVLISAPIMLVSTGCSILSAPDDYAYGGYGSIMPRGDRIHGRVGSISGPTGYVEEEIVEGEALEEGPLEILPPGEEIHGEEIHIEEAI